ncbi:MAG: glycosyltransferase [Candidatus Babeliales bacterium]
MKKKRLVHIISSLKRGGAESLLVDLIKNLHTFDHQVIYFHDGPNRQRLQDIGISTYPVKGLFCLYDPFFLYQLYKLLKKLKPDTIHTALWAANFFGRFLARYMNISFASVIHLGVHQDGFIRNILDALTFRFSGAVIAVSQEVAQSVYDRLWLNAKRISVIPNGINIPDVQREAQTQKISRKQLNLAEDVFVIGSVGRFIPRKNYHLLLYVFARLKKIHSNIALILVGFGSLQGELQRLAKELNVDDSVRFIVGQAAYGYYPLFDCFVLSSLQEGISIALLEAMCFSLPCILTSDQNHEVITNGKNGLIAPVNDEIRLSEALQKIIEDSELRKKFGSEAYQTLITRFNLEKMSVSYERVFNSLIK